MFIIWGKTAKYRRVGYVADFCPMCCCTRPFILERVGMAGHLYYISFGDGELAGHQRVCCTCQNVFNGDPNDYAEFAKTPAPLADLARQTYPNLANARKERLLLESHIQTAPLALPADVRQQLIMEPFLLMQPKLAAFKERSGFSFQSSFVKKNIVPEIGRALARLRPTEQELSDTLARLVQLKNDMGKAVKLSYLMADLQGRADGSITAGRGALSPSYGGRSRDSHEKAASLFRWLAIFGAACLAVVWLTMLMGFVGGGKVPSLDSGALTVAGPLLTMICFKVSQAIAERATWARYTGLALCLPLLGMIPFGTVAGLYGIWHLSRGWHADDPHAAFA